MTRQKLGTICLSFVIASITLYHISAWINIPMLFALMHSNQEQKITIAAHPKVIEPLQSNKDTFQLIPALIQIPSINLQKKVVLSTMMTKNNWSIASEDANFADISAYPNPTSGNTIIFGHDTLKAFSPIHDVKIGDVIYITTAENVFTYKILENKIVSGDAVSIMNQTTHPTLTLFTCDGWFSQNRFVTISEYISYQNK